MRTWPACFGFKTLKTSSTSSHLSMSCPQLALEVFYIVEHVHIAIKQRCQPLAEWLKARTYIARQTASNNAKAPKSFIALMYGCKLNLCETAFTPDTLYVPLHQWALTPQDIPKTQTLLYIYIYINNIYVYIYIYIHTSGKFLHQILYLPCNARGPP